MEEIVGEIESCRRVDIQIGVVRRAVWRRLRSIFDSEL
jgi:hypothetical protein